MKNKKFILFLSTAVTVPFIAVSAIACSTSEVLNTEDNKTISLGNVTGTAGQVANLYKNATDSLAATKDSVTDDALKAALTKFETDVKVETDKMANAEATIRTKISALKVTDSDYATKLTEVGTDLTNSVKAFETAYVTFLKAVDSSVTEEVAKAEFAKVTDLNSLQSLYKNSALPSTQILDLARLFESQAGTNATRLNSVYNDTTGEAKNKVKAYVKTVAQFLNLAAKRELQTVAMALVVVSNKATEEKLVAAVKKVNTSQKARLNLAKLPAAFDTVYKSVMAKLDLLKTNVETADAKSAANGVNADVKTKYDALKAKLAVLVNEYSGYPDTEKDVPGFRKPGLKKNVENLKTNVGAIKDTEVSSNAIFNAFFKSTAAT